MKKMEKRSNKKSSERILIHLLERRDIFPLVEGFQEQGWHKPKSLFECYLIEQEEGRRFVFIAEYRGETAGYVTLIPEAFAGPFLGKKIPEISDFNVLMTCRNKGVGTALMDAAETKACETSPVVTIGVGLHSGYGPAQRMYVKRGYIPDGSGVWYQEKLLEPYAECSNGDDLVLYFSKKLRSDG